MVRFTIIFSTLYRQIFSPDFCLKKGTEKKELFCRPFQKTTNHIRRRHSFLEFGLATYKNQHGVKYVWGLSKFLYTTTNYIFMKQQTPIYENRIPFKKQQIVYDDDGHF